MFRTEKEFQNHFIKDIKESFPDCWIYKIPDVNMQIKPFDIIMCHKGKSYAIELKIVNLKRGLTYEQAYKKLRPNQVGALNAHQKAGGSSYLTVYNKAEDKIYERKFKFLDMISTEL